jgi:hypothetical protein
MSDDDRNVSAREWRAVREGDAHAAPKTSHNNTPESFIVGVGASGALLAGAAIVFVTLVGLVSFNVWPTAQDATTDGNVELSAATPNGPAKNTVVPLSAAAGQVAATNVGTPGTPAGTGGGGNGGNSQGGKSKPKPKPTPSPTPTAPGTTLTPPDSGGSTGTGDGSTGSPPVNAIKDPSHEVSPTHPSGPHQSTPEGDKGKDPDEDGGGVDVGIAGKPPMARPPAELPSPPSSGQDTPPVPSDSSDDGDHSSPSGGDGSSPSGGVDGGCSNSDHHQHDD